MKNKLLTILLALTILTLPTVFAYPLMNIENQKIEVLQKNPADWSAVENGAHGTLSLSYSENVKTMFVNINGKRTTYVTSTYNPRINAQAIGLDKFTDYTLIYYGYGAFNDVWAYATCIAEDKSDSKGYVEMHSYKFNWIPFINDGKNQKFWIVKSSDVDCANNKMVAWNPTKYLFEARTI